MTGLLSPPSRAEARRPPRPAALIRVAVLDDHAAIRAGLGAMLGAEPDLVAVGAASGEAELAWLLRRTDPSVVVIDLHHPGRHGLALSLHLKRRAALPRIVLYTGRGGELVTVAAAVAGVDAVVAKSDSPRAIIEAIRDVGRDAPSRPAVALREQAHAAARLDPADHAILAMRLAGNGWAEIAHTLQLAEGSVAEQGAGIVVRLAEAAPGAERAGVPA